MPSTRRMMTKSTKLLAGHDERGRVGIMVDGLTRALKSRQLCVFWAHPYESPALSHLPYLSSTGQPLKPGEQTDAATKP
jgi:hypothetical protein